MGEPTVETFVTGKYVCDKIKQLFAEMDMQVTVEMYGTEGKVRVIGHALDFERLLGGS